MCLNSLIHGTKSHLLRDRVLPVTLDAAHDLDSAQGRATFRFTQRETATKMICDTAAHHPVVVLCTAMLS